MNEQIIEFLTELRSHNNREWFQDNKNRYDALRKVFIDEVQDLIGRISLFDPEVAGLEAKDCLFRIYRDIRFSPDKTPYKCHFAAYISQGGRASERGGYYIHLEPGGCLLSGGVWCPPPALLKKTFPVLEGEMLKRMPAGYPMDSPYGYIMKHKDFSVVSYKPDNFFYAKNWMDKAVDDFKLLLPFNRFLNYTVDEYLGRV